MFENVWGAIIFTFLRMDFLEIRVFLMIHAPKKQQHFRAPTARFPLVNAQKILRAFSAIYCSFSLYKSTETGTKMSNFSAAFGGFGVPLFSPVFWKSYFC